MKTARARHRQPPMAPAQAAAGTGARRPATSPLREPSKLREPSDPGEMNYWILLDEAAVEALGRGEVVRPLYVVMMKAEDGDQICRGKVPEHIREQAKSMREWMRTD